MSNPFTQLANRTLADGEICADDVLALRRAGWADGSIREDEADVIFAINNKLGRKGDPLVPEWCTFFTEAISDYVVNGAEPRGYVTSANADWLIERITHNGWMCSMTELETLVCIFERAQSVPDDLRSWAIEQIEHEVLTGEGPTRCGGALQQGNVTQAEAQFLRRILFACGSERPAGISRKEAELLFRLKDETLGADNAPEWKTLFVQGVANYLQGFTSHSPLARERAMELEAFMNDTTSSVGNFMGKVARTIARPNRIGEVFGRKAPGPDLTALAEAARAVSGEEQSWLDDRIAANGVVDAYDQALLRFLAED